MAKEVKCPQCKKPCTEEKTMDDKGHPIIRYFCGNEGKCSRAGETIKTIPDVEALDGKHNGEYT